LLYLMITGNLPPAATDRFGEDTLIAPINLPNVNISTVLNDAIMRALGIKLEDRFQTVQEFKAALEGKLTVTPPPSLLPVPTLPRQVGSRSRKRLTAIMVLVMVSIGLFFYFNQNTVPVTPPPWLLDKAQTQWASGNLTAPPGDNAYETYQTILKLEPDNALAKTGLLTMAEHFYNLARLAQERGQMTDSFEQVKHGLQVMPTHVKLLTLEQELMTSFTAQQQVQTRAQQVQQQLDQAAHYLATAQLEAAYTVYQEILTKAPDNQQARAGLQQLAEQYEQQAHRQKNDIVTSLAILEKGLTAFPKHPGLLSLKQELTKKKLTKEHELEETLAQQRKIEELLKTAQQQFLALRLTEPAGDNAYETYQQILNLAPDHQEANAGFINIANEYERLARIQQDNRQKNLALIDKGLKVLPNHAGLLALRQIFTQPPPLPKASEQPLPVAKVSSLVTSPPKEISASVPAHHTTNVVPIPKVKELTTSKASIPAVKATDLSKSQETLADQLVQKGLVIAKQQLEAGQFEEAIQTYQQVLQKAPNNKEATTGLQQIARHYETLARQQTSENHWTASLSFIKKGLAADPSDAGLLTLQGEVTRRLKNELSPPKETKTPQNIIFTPSF
jgi:tetratricopeptide (TPR) repeat protein